MPSSLSGLQRVQKLLLLQIDDQLRSYYLLQHLDQEGEVTNRPAVTEDVVVEALLLQTWNNPGILRASGSWPEAREQFTICVMCNYCRQNDVILQENGGEGVQAAGLRCTLLDELCHNLNWLQLEIHSFEITSTKEGVMKERILLSLSWK